LATVAQRVVERLLREAPPDQAKKLLTDAYLSSDLRMQREMATRIFQGVRAMQESATYLAILDEGREKATRESILLVGDERLGPPEESVKAQLNLVTDLDRLKRMVRCAAKATNWQEILDTPLTVVLRRGLVRHSDRHSRTCAPAAHQQVLGRG
jgi:hypothetical protein